MCFLPLEIWVKVDEYLSATDIVSMSAVSREWYNIAHALVKYLPEKERKVSLKIAVNEKGIPLIPYYGSWDFYYCCSINDDSKEKLVNISSLSGMYELDLSYFTIFILTK